MRPRAVREQILPVSASGGRRPPVGYSTRGLTPPARPDSRIGARTEAQKLIWQQTRQPEPIRRLQSQVPVRRRLAALIEQMMARNPAQRPQTPQEVVDALAPFTEQAIAPPPEDEMPRLGLAASGAQPPPR